MENESKEGSIEEQKKKAEEIRKQKMDEKYGVQP